MTREPTMQEQVIATKFLFERYGAAVTAEHTLALACVFAEMREKELGYAIEHLSHDAKNGPAVDELHAGRHLP